MPRQLHATGTPWEPIVGYSRCVRVGQLVWVSGTTALDAQGQLVGHGDAYAQTLQCIRNIEQALLAVAARIEHVVRTRMFVTNIADWEAVGRAHGEWFKNIRPATSMVEVAKLIHPDLLIEIEADAFID